MISADFFFGNAVAEFDEAEDPEGAIEALLDLQESVFGPVAFTVELRTMGGREFEGGVEGVADGSLHLGNGSIPVADIAKIEFHV